MFFIEIKGLLNLEQEKNWFGAIELLSKKWREDSQNADLLIRLVGECWSIREEHIEDNKLNKYVKEVMVDCYNYFTRVGVKDNKCLFVFGYMLMLFPFYFYVQQDESGEMYLAYEQKGKELIKMAYDSEQSNPLYEVAYLRSCNKGKLQYKSAFEKLQSILGELFCGKTLIEQYFLEMFSERI